MKVTVCRKEQFNAAHRLYNSAWSDEKNEQVFGKCNIPNFHGHNYELVVKLSGEPDPETGYVYDLKKLSRMIRKNVLTVTISNFYFRVAFFNVPVWQSVIRKHEMIKRV